ncbi:MAG: Gfo/Idh/MocA family oxidoreductase [Gammaproteobacteria bacterium]|nr:Gfo/Idh/MocA family oxidoreductase [Gammaproteobacteria bacterium]
MTNKIIKNIAVIGSGYWGKNLIRVFAELGVLHSICDSNVDLAQQFAERYCVNVHAWEEVLNNPEITSVALAVPASQHAKFAKQAILANKHVFVEKPIALDVKDAEELCDLASKYDRILMVGHLLHYHPAFIKLKELISQGSLGKLQYIYSNRLSLGKIRREEDILWSFAPHDISMILSLVNQEPTEVKATAGYYLNKNIADVTTTHLTFASGEQAHIFVSWLHPIKEQKIVVIGDKSMAVFDDTQDWQNKLTLYSHQLKWLDGIPQFDKAEGVKLALIEDEPLKNELMHFIDCVQNHKQPRTDGHEAVRVLKVLQQASIEMGLSLSGKENKPEIKINTQTNYFVHETALVDEKVELGEGTKIWHFSHILSRTKLGKNCIIGQNVMIGPEVTVGDNCKIQNNVSLYKGVTLGRGVFCGPSCVFTNVNTPRAEVERKDEFLPTPVGDGVTIGANATIVCGSKLGEYCFIGAGAVVTKDVPPHALMVGNPARQIGWVSHAGERLGPDLICPREKRAYKINQNNLIKQLEEVKEAKESISIYEHS